jgi:glycosyltransferase involved in cell wall biosynthesis
LISLLHVVGAGIDEYRLLSLQTLLDRLPPADFHQRVAAIDVRMARRAEQFLRRPILLAAQRLRIGLSCGPRLRSYCRDGGVAVLHAWGADALAACAAAADGPAVVATGILPHDLDRAARWLRQIAPTATVVASGQVARAQLVQRGIPADRAAVIRGAVDFATINEARRSAVREALVGAAGPVILLAGPARRGDGAFEAVWACAMLQRLLPDIRVVMPFGGHEADRLTDLARRADTPAVPIRSGDRFSWPQLLTAADALVVAPPGEADTEPIGWAMAAGVPVVGAARRSVAELIADHSNGLLARTNAPRLLASALLRLFEDSDLRRRIADTARGQAFEVFSVRTFCDNHAALYRNIAAGRPPTDGIADAAMVA